MGAFVVLKSQSPQIGADVITAYVPPPGTVFADQSQSPQIGADVITEMRRIGYKVVNVSVAIPSNRG